MVAIKAIIKNKVVSGRFYKRTSVFSKGVHQANVAI